VKNEAIELVKMNTIQTFLQEIKKDSLDTTPYLAKLRQTYLNKNGKIDDFIKNNSHLSTDYHEKLHKLKNIHSFFTKVCIHTNTNKIWNVYNEIMKDFKVDYMKGIARVKTEEQNKHWYFLDFIANEKYFDNIAQNVLNMGSHDVSIFYKEIQPYEYDLENTFIIKEYAMQAQVPFWVWLFFENIIPLFTLALFVLSAKNFTFQQMLLSVCVGGGIAGITLFLVEQNFVIFYNISTFVLVLSGCNISATQKNSSLVFGLLTNIVFSCQIMNFLHFYQATKVSVFVGDLMLLSLGCAVLWMLHYLDNEHKISPKA
jgi:hypothetical protein